MLCHSYYELLHFDEKNMKLLLHFKVSGFIVRATIYWQ